MNVTGKFFCGKSMYPFTPATVDLSLPDDQLWEKVLHDAAMQWSSCGDQPNFKSAMMRNGYVMRVPDGSRVVISGAGWSVTCETEEHAAERKRLAAAKDWEGLSKHGGLSEGNQASVTKFNWENE